VVDLARDDAASAGSTARTDGQAAGSPAAGGAGATLRLIATVGSPIAIATGLLFYFGWVRASVQARQLGYDTAILDWTIQDYILRSVNVLFIPLMALLIVALVLTWLHQRLVVPMVESGRPAGVASRLPRALRASWLLWVPAGLALAVVSGSLSGFLVAATVTLALLCAVYAELLERRVSGSSRTPPAAVALILVLLALSLFWDAERLANVMGEGYAAQITANPRRWLLAVTVYSPKSLEIDAHGVVETRLGTSESAYRYRYDGLRLVQRSGDRYLLMSERWDARTSRIIVLRDTDAIRMEFAR
jgi:hypothetical protein